MRKIRFVTPVLVLLAMLLVGLLPASAGQPGTGTTTIYVQNADPSNSAQIVTDFYGLDGTSAGTVNVASLPPYVGYTVSTASASPALPSSWNGSVVVSSDRQVAAVGHTIYENVPTASDRLTAGDYTALAGPQDTSFMPYVFNASGRNSIFAVQNTEGSAATVYIHYYRKADGTEIPGSGACSGSPVVDTIPASGVVYYDLLNQTRNGAYDGGAGGMIPCMDTAGTGQPSAGTLGGFNGSIYITSTNQIAVTNSTHWASFEGAYTGATADDTYLYFPQLARYKSGGGSWVRWSTLVVQNTQTFPISITVSLLGASPGAQNLVFSDTIPALSNVGYNTRYQGSFDSSMWVNCTDRNRLEPTCWMEQALGTAQWTGAGAVQVNTPGGRIVGVSHIQYADGRMFTYEGLQPSSASQIVVCPIMMDFSGSNQRWSAAIVQNSSTAIATVDLYLFTQGNATGGLAGADLKLDNGTAGYQIAAGERAGFNTAFDTAVEAASAFNPLGNSWTGSMVVVSRDQPILVTMSMFRAQGKNNWGVDYNCYNVP